MAGMQGPVTRLGATHLDEGFSWKDQRWCGMPLTDLILYELHVGTFTPEGTFESVIPCLDKLQEMGITVEGEALNAFPVSLLISEDEP
jgi:1,4-alpha-glucan branching enzyme